MVCLLLRKPCIIADMLGPEFGHFVDHNEPIFERIARYGGPEKRKRTSVVCDTTNARSGYGAKANEVIRGSTDEEVIDAVIEQVEKHDLVFARLMDLASVQGCKCLVMSRLYHADKSGNGPTPPVDTLPVPGTSSNEDTESEKASNPLSQSLASLNKHLERINSSLPRNTALILVTGHSNPVPMRHMNERRQKWERLVKTLGGTDDIPKEERWLAEDDRELEAIVNQAREGMAFFCVK
jgi:RNA exonuclease 1